MIWLVLLAVVVAVLTVLAVVDVVQNKHAIRHNFPVVGRLRYVLERVGPELRQYIVTSNDEERPFTRDQRRWVYSTAKRENPYFGFGTDNKMDLPQYLLVRHAAFPYPSPGDDELVPIPAAKVLGEWRDRPRAFRPGSIVNISAMSYGSLSARAIEALNRGAAIAGCLHNTGEGGVSAHHLHGGDLTFQIGTGYFGARDSQGRFDLDQLVEKVETMPIKAVELKLSQGAKPGLGGVLPGAKVTPEIARVRGVEVGKTVVSPSTHSAFDSVPSMIDFVERVADACGVPVGIKSAVGQRQFWVELADDMRSTGRGPDFITIDGGEGGTGAAPLVFADNVSLPFRSALAEVFATFAERGMHEQVVWVGAGKLGFPGAALLAMTLGADLINVGREAMLALGCIQAQECHTGHCPTGVATQNSWLMRGLDPGVKSARVANYLVSLRHDLLRLTHACGVAHPAMVGGEAIELLLGGEETVPLWDKYDYDSSWRDPATERLKAVAELMP
ncbi:MAG: FMN-binding glutamate synthase family protein [Acidimicrobiia bacterium]|nr:FMN-binding glutamate synthase family protein [Acidimicrobiia bacterium]